MKKGESSTASEEEGKESINSIKENVREFVKSTIEKHLIGRTIQDEGICEKCANWISEEIRNKLKQMLPNFYIHCFCVVQEYNNFSWAYASHNFDKEQFDGGLAVEYHNKTFRAFVDVFVVKNTSVKSKTKVSSFA